MNNDVIIRGKKSLRGIRKQKIDLFSIVVDFNIFSNMIKFGKFPLVVKLSDDQLKDNTNNELSLLMKYYVRKDQFDDEFSNRYMVLDSIELEKEFYEEKLYINKYFDNNGEDYIVDVLYPGKLQEGYARIGILRRKGILFDKSNLLVYSIRDMYMNAYKKYMEDNKKSLLASIDNVNCTFSEEQRCDNIFVKKKK